MANKIIHGVNVEYEEDSSSVNDYLDHLENELSHEEMKNFVENARHDHLNKTHLEDNHGNRVTMEYKSDGSCLIRKRQG